MDGQNQYQAGKHNKMLFFVFEGLFQSFFCIFVIHVFQIGMRFTLQISGFSYLTIENMDVYIRNPVTIFGLFLLILLIGILLFYEIRIMIVFFAGPPLGSITQAAGTGIKHSAGLFGCRPLLVWMPLTALFCSLFYILPVLLIGMNRFRGFESIVSAIFQDGRLQFWSIVFVLLLLLLGFFCVFVPHFCLLEKSRVGEAFYKSAALFLKHPAVIITRLVFINIFMNLVLLAAYHILLAASGAVIYKIAEGPAVMPLYLGVYDKLNAIWIIFFASCSMAVNVYWITKLFLSFHHMENEACCCLMYAVQKPGPRYVLGIRVFFLTAAFYSCFHIYNWMKHGTFTSSQALFSTMITAHRGSSLVTPENTLLSVVMAEREFADYAEIDIQLTKDGTVVLMHDETIQRTTDGTGFIWEHTYEELQQVDSGSWFSSAYSGLLVPKLSEVLDFAKGRILLNIEIKMNGHNEEIVEKTTALIEAFHFEQQCVITSMDYAVLSEVKERNPEIKTGYILPIAYGDFLEKTDADFFSIKHNFIHEDLVLEAHSRGKGIHAWTVNSRAELERMKKLGVDNIITDDPKLAREVVFSNERESLASFLRLFIGKR